MQLAETYLNKRKHLDQDPLLCRELKMSRSTVDETFWEDS